MNGRLLATTALVCFLLAGCQPAEPEAPPARWWKGNLHTHSYWSDGDDFPEMIVAWYADRDYHFLALSDHNTFAEGEKWMDVSSRTHGMDAYSRYTERFGEEWVVEETSGDTLRVRLKTLDEYRPRFEKAGQFSVFKSEEITDSYGVYPIHMNATNLLELVRPLGGNSVLEVMQNNVDAVLEQRARTGQPMMPHINHPNFGWGISVEDMIALTGDRFFEVYNGHPAVRNDGDSLHLSTERMWDVIQVHRIERGDELFYGLAVDDSHNYHEMSSENSNPGRGWIMVRADTLDAAAIILAMEAGDFYGSSGVTLEDVRFDGERLSVSIQPEDGVTYVTQFIGTRADYAEAEADGYGYSTGIGVVLAEAEGLSPAYTLQGDELYVRAKVVSSKMKENPYAEGEVEVAWTQPVVPARR
jgi:hypothetical protein